MINMRTVAVAVMAIAMVACTSPEQRAAKYLARAQASFEAGDMVKAELDAKNTLQIEPQNADARFLLARIAETQLLTNQAKWREMMGQLRRVVELDPGRIEARTKLAQLYLRFMTGGDLESRQNIIELAREQVDAAAAIAPDDTVVRTLLPMVAYHEAVLAGDNTARDAAIAESDAIFDEDPTNVLVTSFLAGLSAADNPDRALSYLDRSLAAEPQSALRVLKIGLLQGQNRLSEAEQEYRTLIDENPDNTEIKYGLVKFYVDSGQLDKAETLLRQVVADAPEDVNSNIQLASFLVTKGDIEGAEQMLEDRIAAAPEAYDYQFLLAQLALQQERTDSAEEIMQQIIDRAGTADAGLRARNQIARLRVAQERRTEAEELIDEVLAEEPANEDALMMKAALQLERGETDSAISGLRTVLRGNPTSERALLVMARAQMVAGNPSLAKESYQKLVAAHPRNADARRELARVMVTDRQWDEVRNLLIRGVELHPDDLQMTRMLVDTLIRIEDWEAAQLQADRIIDIEETRPLGHYLQGRIHQARDRLPEAIESFHAAIELQPRAIEPLTNLVRSYLALDQAEEARRYLEQFMQFGEQNVHAQTLLAEVEARLGNFDAAIAANSRALDINARWVPAYRNLIGLHLLQGDDEAAEEAAHGALEIMPDHVDLHLLLATVYERQERFQEAIEIYERELERNPDLDVAVNNYAALVADHYADETELLRALQLAQRFRNSDNPIFLDTLGWLLYRTGDYEEAVKVLEEAVAGAGGVAQLRYHLGMAYYNLDRLDVAKSELQAAVATEEPFVGLEEARQTLELL